MSSSPSPAAVNLVVTHAPLLSGKEKLSDCATADDDTCIGGMAAVAAIARNRTAPHQRTLVLPFSDPFSLVTQLHPLKMGVHRAVIHDLLGWNVFLPDHPNHFLGELGEQHNENQPSRIPWKTTSMPLLLTNIDLPPHHSWNRYSVPIYFDESTGIAVLFVAELLFSELGSQLRIASALNMLDYIAAINQEKGCTEEQAEYDAFFNQTTEYNESKGFCWIPVILLDYYIYDSLKFNSDVNALTHHKHPPALVIDMRGLSDDLKVAQKVGPNRTGMGGTWATNSFARFYQEYHITLTANRRWIAKVKDFHQDDSNNSSSNDIRNDPLYRSDIESLHMLAEEAAANDYLVGYTEAISEWDSEGNFLCDIGECAVGNLYADALLRKAETQIAFVSDLMAGVGSGLPEGGVNMSTVRYNLRFGDQFKVGVMSGLTILELLNCTVSEAPFLLQVSGMRYSYNKNITTGSRLLSVDVWNETKKIYQPLERSKHYSFVTDDKSLVWCSHWNWSAMPGENEGEPLSVSPSITVADFLSNRTSQYQPYPNHTGSRVIEKPTTYEALNFVQTKASCDENTSTYWNETLRTCFDCDAIHRVSFLDTQKNFTTQFGSGERLNGTVRLFNDEIFSVTVKQVSAPKWINLVQNYSSTGIMHVHPRQNLALMFTVDSLLVYQGRENENNPWGSDGILKFSVTRAGRPSDCANEIQTFIRMTVTPKPKQKQLEDIRIAGLVLMAIAVVTTIFFALWVIFYRKKRVVASLQPPFLLTVCAGLVIIASSIVPFSIDDSVASSRGCDIACMSQPWLVSMGFTITMSALFTKLWRINKIFRVRQFRRVVVGVRDVVIPFATLLVSNFAVLLTWTLRDPLTWKEKQIEGQSWNTYGRCVFDGKVGKAMAVLTGFVCATSLLLACYQAFLARNISDEFSESKNLGMALFCWFQILAVGFPVLALLDDSNVAVVYFIYVALIFALCMLMLFFIFLPILVDYRIKLRTAFSIRNGVTGLELERPTGTSGSP